MGSSKDDAIIRNKDTGIKCSDPSFDDYVCLKREDLKDLMEQMLYRRDE